MHGTMPTEEAREALTFSLKAAEIAARRAAAPKYWILFATTDNGRDHVLFATREEAEAALMKISADEAEKRGELPPTDAADALGRFYEDIYFSLFEAPLGFWAESV
jgi:hypothetical protein